MMSDTLIFSTKFSTKFTDNVTDLQLCVYTHYGGSNHNLQV